MSRKKQAPYYIALKATSQGNSENVLYYNANASLDAIYECATARINAVINLHQTLYEHQNPPPDALTALSSITALLLTDATTLLESLEPIAMELRKEK